MYKLIIKSAFSSLFQRKTRTILVILMIASSLYGLMLLQGVYEGMIAQMINNAIKSDCGEISLFAKNYRSEKDIKLQIKNTQEIEQILQENSHIKSYSKKIVSQGLIATAKYNKNANIYGIDLGKEQIHSSLDTYIIDGKYDFGIRDNGVIIGFSLARKLKINIGKKVILSAQNIHNEVSSIALKVTGIIKTNNMAFDESGIFIDFKKAKSFLGTENPNQMTILFQDFKSSSILDLNNSLKAYRNDIDIFSWEELYPALLQSRDLMSTFTYISYLIVFCTATIGIFGVVLVSVLERLTEFGILQAIGTRFYLIVAMIFFESFFIGFIGFIVGSIAGGFHLWYLSIFGLDLSSFSDALSEFGMDSIIYADIKVEYFITAFIAVFLANFLSILIPLRIIKKSKPIEVIHG